MSAKTKTKPRGTGEIAPQTISKTKVAALLGFTRQHLEFYIKKTPGFPNPIGIDRPTVTRKDGISYLGAPYPVYEQAAVLKWIKDNDIKRQKNPELFDLRSLVFDNEMAQRFIRRPLVDNRRRA